MVKKFQIFKEIQLKSRKFLKTRVEKFFLKNTFAVTLRKSKKGKKQKRKFLGIIPAHFLISLKYFATLDSSGKMKYGGCL